MTLHYVIDSGDRLWMYVGDDKRASVTLASFATLCLSLYRFPRGRGKLGKKYNGTWLVRQGRGNNNL